MSLVSGILRAYAAPRQAFAAELARLSEPRSLMLVMLFCLLTYIARLPELAMTSALAGDDPATARGRYGAMFVATMMMAPMVLYGLAALSHLVLRPFGGQGSWASARLALFWSALVTAPLVLIGGALKVFSPGPAFLVVQLATAVVFFWQWAACLSVAEFGGRQKRPA